MTLVVPDAIREAIEAHAEAGTPEEVVGVLAGEYDASRSIVRRAYRGKNVADRPQTRYEIAPETELELLEHIDAADLECVGFYHSHPNGSAEPSETDARLAAWADYSYLIVSLAGTADLESWRWTGERFERESIHRV